MYIGLERLKERYGNGSKTGLVVKSPGGGCGGCPAVGMGCGSCPSKSAAVISEVSVLKSVKLPILGKTETKVSPTGSIPFRPLGETVTPTSEKTCFQCGKNPNTCPHSGTNLKAA